MIDIEKLQPQIKHGQTISWSLKAMLFLFLIEISLGTHTQTKLFILNSTNLD